MEHKKRNALAILGIVVLVLSVLYGFNCREEGSRYAAALLSLSLVLEFVILRVDDSDTTSLARRLAWIEGLKVLFGALYWWVSRLDEVTGALMYITCGAAWFAFFCAIAVVWTTFRFTSAAMGEDHKDPYWSLVSHLSSNTIQALCCMLLAFLHIAYFMTFALALDDKRTNGRSVHRTASFVTPAEGEEDALPVKLDDTTNQSTCGAPHRQRVRKLFFQTGLSDLNYERELKSKVDPQTLQAKICGSDQNGREVFLWGLTGKQRKDATDREELQIRAAAWNLREEYELRALLMEMKNENGYDYRAQIQGHASDELPTDARNFNNVDRSWTRTQYVQRMLLELAIATKVRPLLCEIYAAGNDDTFLEPDKTRWYDVALNSKLSVEVWLRPIPLEPGPASGRSPRQLTLIDYTYFMIYTITTTGYGDIVPSSSFSRFLTSMANLFELFFLVIIFNATLALRRDPEAKTNALSQKDSGGTT